MQLPKTIADKIAALLDATNIDQLRTASKQLTENYHTSHRGVRTPDQHLAYVAARMPATYAVCRAVLDKIGHQEIKSLLDLGAGPGTASLAAKDVFLQLDKLTLVDKDQQFRSIALELLPSIQYALDDLTHFVSEARHDLVLCSYVLNELNDAAATKLVMNAWQATQQFLVLIEPGTPAGYTVLKNVRQQLMDEGAYVVAPCTHHQACPLTGNDWCHFSAHVDRSSYHRLAKDAALSYEHEKYSYMIFSRQAVDRPLYRVIKRPMQRSGHVIFDLCGDSGVHRSTVSKKQKDRYSLARKISWGDGWDFEDD
jgi:ribosomal protein RSM22 (predicted rRNA methylase)